jgi:hypothetical protein
MFERNILSEEPDAGSGAPQSPPRSRAAAKRLRGLETEMLARPDQQISLTNPDSRSMATSGRGSGVVGYNVQVAVETKHHLIVTRRKTFVIRQQHRLAGVNMTEVGHAASSRGGGRSGSTSARRYCNLRRAW